MIKEALKVLIKEQLLAEGKHWRFHMMKQPNLVYKEKTVQVDSVSHIKLLKNTLEHLEALKKTYAAGSANRHIIAQTCTRIKRLLAKLEKKD